MTGSARELLITSHVIELRSSRGNHHADAMRSARLLMRVATKMWKRLRDEHGSQ